MALINLKSMQPIQLYIPLPHLIGFPETRHVRFSFTEAGGWKCSLQVDQSGIDADALGANVSFSQP